MKSVAIAAVILGAGSLIACGKPSTTETVVLITLDTTRADRIGAYGYARARTPNLDRIAAEGARFDGAMSVAPTTLPSHASMFTGRYPAEHGVRYNGMFVVPPEAVTLAETLSSNGWRTAAVPAAFPVATASGIGQGFQEFRDLFAEKGAKDLPPHAERIAEDVTDQGLAILEASNGKKLFLWLHYYDPHFPYAPPFPFSAEFREHPYDGEIAYMDREIGRFLDGLRAAGRFDDALVIAVGDHGEGLYDHGEKLHAYLVYQSTMAVPFLVRPPGGGGGAAVEEPVSIIDVFPTILDYAGVGERGATRAISLRNAIEGGEIPRRSLYFESLAGSLVFGWSPLEGLRRGAWKFVRSTEPELFEIANDPGETSNRHASDAGIAADLGALLEDELRHFGQTATPPESTSAPLDREALERLASLGYVGGTLTEERRGGPHPRRFIHFESEILHGQRLMAEGEHRSAVDIFDRLLAEDPTNRYALTQACILSSRMRELDRAIEYAGKLTSSYPEFVDGWVYHGEALVAVGKLPEAERVFREALERHAADASLTYRLGVSLLAQSKFEEAEAVLRSGPGSSESSRPPTFSVALAAIAARRGDLSAARKLLESAIARGYDDREVLLSEPLLDPVRKIPGFQEIVATIPQLRQPPRASGE